MKEKTGRDLKLNRQVFVVDNEYLTHRAFVESGFIFQINKREESFIITFYHDDYRRYSFKDLGKSVFFEKEEAERNLKIF